MFVNVFVPDKPFQPSLNECVKAGAYLNDPLCGRPLALPTNITLGMPRTNSLTYYERL
jgi:hypothetical protein